MNQNSRHRSGNTKKNLNSQSILAVKYFGSHMSQSFQCLFNVKN